MVFFQSCKTVSVFILIIHILLQKSEKHVTEKYKDWIFEVSLLIREPISWFRLFESLKMTWARSYAWFLNFLSDREGFNCFLWPNVLSKPSKMTETCPKSEKWLSILSSLKVAKWPVLKFMYLQSWGSWQVNLIQRVPLGTLPQKVVMSLPHNHVTLTNLFISSYRGYCYQIWSR